MLRLKGDPYERGRQHGMARRELIHQRAAAMLPEFYATPTTPRSLGALRRQAAPWWRAIKRASPNLAAELRGIAAGSHQPVPVVVLLNAFEAFDLSAQVGLGGCTTVAISDGRGALVGQNWDANPSLGSTVEIHHHIDPGGTDVVVLASPGGLGWIGINEHGVALANSDIMTKKICRGVPSQAVRRLMLEQSSAEAAVGLLGSLAPVGGRAYMIGDAAGDIFAVEVAAEESSPSVAIGPGVHTNHALQAPISQWEEVDVVAKIYPSTLGRYRRATLLLADGEPCLSTLRQLLADHRDRPLSICRHHASEEPTVTAASAIFDCRERTAHIAIGNPCRTAYRSVRLLSPE